LPMRPGRRRRYQRQDDHLTLSLPLLVEHGQQLLAVEEYYTDNVTGVLFAAAARA